MRKFFGSRQGCLADLLSVFHSTPGEDDYYYYSVDVIDCFDE